MAAATSTMGSLMDLLHDRSLPTIGLLQTSFPNNQTLMINISTLFDPRYVFLIYAPILFALNRRVGHRMIIALTWAEWANQILKWLLAGERPYWYVHERAHQLERHGNATGPGLELAGAGPLASMRALTGQLKQFPVTCELGAGSPSGHAMVTATVWYILIDAYLRAELNPFARADYARAAGGPKPSGAQLAKVFWAIYTAMLALVSLSRVYLACHFPHQCLAGALLGCLLARLVAERLPMGRLRRGHFVAASCWMFASALATYAALRLTGFDPLWSVGKAMRWCVKSEYIHLDTTPFFSMMRYLGFCLGAGLAYEGRKLAASEQPAGARPPRARSGSLGLAGRRLLALLAAIGFGQLLLGLPLPKSSQNLFYAGSFLVYTLFAYAVAGPIPDLAKGALRARREQLKHR